MLTTDAFWGSLAVQRVHSILAHGVLLLVARAPWRRRAGKRPAQGKPGARDGHWRQARAAAGRRRLADLTEEGDDERAILRTERRSFSPRGGRQRRCRDRRRHLSDRDGRGTSAKPIPARIASMRLDIDAVRASFAVHVDRRSSLNRPVEAVAAAKRSLARPAIDASSR